MLFEIVFNVSFYNYYFLKKRDNITLAFYYILKHTHHTLSMILSLYIIIHYYTNNKRNIKMTIMKLRKRGREMFCNQS